MPQEDHMPHDAAYGKRLRQLREKRGLTQAELVKRMVAHGVGYMNTSTLSRIEAGTRPVRLSEANVIVSIFGVDARYMTLNDDLVAFYAQDLREMLALHARFTTGSIEFAQAQSALRRTRAGLLTSTDPDTVHAVRELESDFDRWASMDLVEQVREIVARVANHETETVGKAIAAAEAGFQTKVSAGSDGEHQAEA